MDAKKLNKANDLASRITFVENQINDLTTKEGETFPYSRIEANIVMNNSCGSSCNDYANLTSKQKQELLIVVRDMLKNNLEELEEEFEKL